MSNNYPEGISVILPNYNGKSLLEHNLPSIRLALQATGLPYEIIVVDDCSTDDSKSYISQHHPDIKLLSTEVNSGFSKTCNTGIRAAKYRLSCVVNTDVTFDPQYFKKALPYFEDPKVFALKGNILNYVNSRDNVVNIEKDVRLYYQRGFLRFDHNFDTDDTDYDLQFSLLGCCFLSRSDILKKLGGFDEIFSPYFWEDSDLALRGIALGYKVIYAPECIVYHKISSTISSTSSKHKRQLISRRNKFLFTWKHLQGGKRWVGHVVIIIVSLLSRWLVLDWKFYLSLGSALNRLIRWNPTHPSN